MKNILIKLIAVVALLNSTNGFAKVDIQTWSTSNGANVFYVPISRLPMVDIRVVFAAGSAHDNGNLGVANMTNALLDTAAAGKSAQELAQALENVGAQISNGSLREMAWYQMRTLSYSEPLKVATDILAEVLGEADLVESEFERIKKSFLISIKDSKQSPSSLGSQAFYKALYGKHPYAFPSEGTQQTLNAMTLSDVKTFYKQFYVAKNATIVIVGDVDRDDAEKLAEKLVAKLKAGSTAKSIPSVDPLVNASTEYIAFPAKQSHVFIGQLGISRDDPDYFTLYVANHILGGSGFTSRIVDEVREKRGLAYSAYSYFAPMAQQGPFTMGLQTKNEQVEEAIRVMMDTLTTFIKDGPTEKELDAALSNITGSAALRTDSNKKIAEYVSMIGFYKLPLNYLEQLNSRFREVTVAGIKSAMKKRIDPQKMITIVVGASSEQKKK